MRTESKLKLFMHSLPVKFLTEKFSFSPLFTISLHLSVLSSPLQMYFRTIHLKFF